MKKMILVMMILAFLPVSLAIADGTIIPPGANTTVTVTEESDYGYTYAPYFSEIITVTCPYNTLIVGGGVMCSSENYNSSTSNTIAFTKSHNPAGNSFIGTCMADVSTINTSKYGPPITVYAICLRTLPPMREGTKDVPGEPSQEAVDMAEQLKAQTEELMQELP